MKIFILMIMPICVYADHWEAFISCGFYTEDGHNITNILAPNYGIVFVNMSQIEFVRGYRGQRDGITCSTIHLKSGENVVVVGNTDSVLRRLDKD